MKVLATVIMLVVWGYFGAIYEPQASGLQVVMKNVNLAIPVMIVFMWLPALGRFKGLE